MNQPSQSSQGLLLFFRQARESKEALDLAKAKLRPKTKKPTQSWRACWQESKLWPTIRTSMLQHCKPKTLQTRCALLMLQCAAQAECN